MRIDRVYNVDPELATALTDPQDQALLLYGIAYGYSKRRSNRIGVLDAL